MYPSRCWGRVTAFGERIFSVLEGWLKLGLHSQQCLCQFGDVLGLIGFHRLPPEMTKSPSGVNRTGIVRCLGIILLFQWGNIYTNNTELHRLLFGVVALNYYAHSTYQIIRMGNFKRILQGCYLYKITSIHFYIIIGADQFSTLSTACAFKFTHIPRIRIDGWDWL